MISIRAPASLGVQLRYDVKCHGVPASFLLREDSRLDAGAYSVAKVEALTAIEQCRLIKTPFGKLCGTIWHPVQNQARSNFKRVYTKKAHGDPYVGSREMFFFPLRPEKFLSRAFPKLQELRVPEGWLLLSRSGTVGNALYCSKKLAQCLITDHAIRIQPLSAPAGYLYAFLACKYGKPLISSATYGAIVSELEPKHLSVLPVPMADPAIQQSIHDRIIRAYELRDTANDLLESAEDKLHGALRLAPFSDEDVEYIGDKERAKAFTIPMDELGERFDAAHHVPFARSALHKLQKCAVPLQTLKESGVSVFIPGRFKRNYVETNSGTVYLVPSQITLIRPYDIKYLAKSQAAESPEYLLETGELLVTTDGTIGRLHLVTEAMRGWFGSNNLARLRSATVDLGFLYAFLATPFGQHQICREIYGGVVDHINDHHLETVWLPQLPMGAQQTIGDAVRKAFSLKDEANDLETRAIAQMETVIGGY